MGGWLLGSGQMNFKANRASTQKDIPSNLNYADVERVYDELRSKYDGDLDVNKLMDGLKKGLVSASGDPYTEYLAPKEAEEFSGQLNGTFEGIGAYLGKNEQGNVIVISPVDGFPAKKLAYSQEMLSLRLTVKTQLHIQWIRQLRRYVDQKERLSNYE